MVVKWFYHKDGHHGSLLYIVKEQQWGDKSESLVLEQDANSVNAQVILKDDGREMAFTMQKYYINMSC